MFSTHLVEFMDEKPIWEKWKISNFSDFSKNFMNFGQDRSESGRRPETTDPNRQGDIEITNPGDRNVKNVFKGVRYTC